MHSLSEENYLKAIYRLSLPGENKVTPTAIAEALGNNPASVIDMLKKLSDKKLITYNKIKGAKLSDKGNKAAIDIVRKHRLWEEFLVQKLGYSWDVVHDIAEQLEHVHYLDLADKLDKFLGFPKYDPHGDPIPKANGQIANVFKTLLGEITVGKNCQVVAVKDTSSEFLKYLQKLNIGIGTKLKVVENIPFDESIVILIDKKHKTTISKKFGQSILVD